MTLYNEIGFIFPYLVSLRKLENYLSFDIEFPKKWKIPKKYVIEDKIIERSDNRPEMRSFSFVCEFESTKLEQTMNSLKNIILHNKEIEEKEELFNNKVLELKNIFEKQNLEKLHNLKFELITDKINLIDNEEHK